MPNSLVMLMNPKDLESMADLNYTMLNPVRKVHMPARFSHDVDTHSLAAQCCKGHTRYIRIQNDDVSSTAHL